MTTIRDGNGAAGTGLRSRQVCDHCGGPFGMVTHRWWGNRGMERDQREYARTKPQRQLHLPLYD